MLIKAVRATLPLNRGRISVPAVRNLSLLASPNRSAPGARHSIVPNTVSSSFSRPMSSSHGGESTLRPEPDKVLQDIADYVHNYKINSDLAYETARLCLIDTIGCGLEALRFPECTKLLGPVVEGTVVPNGMHSPSFTKQLIVLLITQYRNPRAGD